MVYQVYDTKWLWFGSFDVRHLGRGALYNEFIYDTGWYDIKDLVKKSFTNKNFYHITIDDHL